MAVYLAVQLLSLHLMVAGLNTYVRATIPSGQAVAWREREIHYVIERSTSSNVKTYLSDAQLAAVTQEALGRWEQGCSPLLFIFDGFVNPDEVPGGEDGQNVVRFISSGWCDDGATCRGSAVAVTRLFVDAQGTIREADIELDAEHNSFALRGSGPSDAIAIEAVLTHESGHVIGLAHPAQGEGGVMEDGHVRGSTSVFEPSNDELSFVCATYTEAALTPSGAKPLTPAAKGCSAGSPDGAAASVLGLVSLWLSRQRRRRWLAVAACAACSMMPLQAQADEPAQRDIASLQGPTGVLRVMSALPVQPDSAAFSLRFGIFTASPWLIQPGGRQDRNTRMFGVLTYTRAGPDYRLLRDLEFFASLSAQLNENQRNDPGRRDSAQQVSIGNIAFGARGGGFVAPGLAIGGSMRGRMFATPFSSGFGAFGVDADVLGTYDFRVKTKAPLRAHLNLGIHGDTSFGALPDSQCLSRTVDVCYRSRAVQTFAFNVNTSQASAGAAVDAPIATQIGATRWAFTPFVEWTLNLAVGPGDQPLARALAASGVNAGRFADRFAQNLSVGVRVAPELPVVFEVAADIGLQTPSLRYGGAQPPWQIMAGIAYVFDREEAPPKVHQARSPASVPVAVEPPANAQTEEPALVPLVVAASQPASEPVLTIEPDTLPLVAPSGEGLPAPAPLAFKIGENTLDPDAMASLDKLAADLAAHPEIVRVKIVGHTDSQGNANKNVTLSEKRAQAVKDYLVKKGVAETRIVASGAGGVQPLVPNLTAANRAKNNRVEIELGRLP